MYSDDRRMAWRSVSEGLIARAQRNSGVLGQLMYMYDGYILLIPTSLECVLHILTRQPASHDCVYINIYLR